MLLIFLVMLNNLIYNKNKIYYRYILFFIFFIMISKILWFFVLVFVTYILLVFYSPKLASTIEKTIWIEGFNEYVLSLKRTYDNTVAKIPTAEELKNTYNSFSSWALEYKQRLQAWLEFTRDQIDAIRSAASWAEEKINSIKGFVESNSGNINNFKKLVDWEQINQELITKDLLRIIETNTWSFEVLELYLKTNTWSIDVLNWIINNISSN